MAEIRVGIIGGGKSGRAHIEAVRSIGGATVAAIAVRDAARAAELCELYGIPVYYTDYRELLADREINVVHNCTPNFLHYRVNADCIIAGKHVLSEKPLTISSGQSQELLTLIKSHNVMTAVNFTYRHYRAAARLRDMVKNGELGRIYSISGAYLQDWLSRDTDYDWRVESRLAGPSRAMGDIGSHWCDLAQFVLGDDVAAVCADFATFIPARTDFSRGDAHVRRVEVDTEDYCGALLRFSKGARGTLVVSQVSAGEKTGISLRIDGSKASARWDRTRAGLITLAHRDKTPDEITVAGGKPDEQPADALKNMIESFYASILRPDMRSEPRRFADFEEGHKIVRVVEAIVASDKSRSWQSAV